MGSTDRIAVVREMMDAFSRRDADGFIRHMRDDVLVRSTPYVTGRADYRGHDAIRDGMEKMVQDFAATGKRLRILDVAYYVDGTDERRVLVLGRIKIQRATGEEFGTDIAYLSTFDGDMIGEVEAWLDHAEALAQLGNPIQVT